jgi:hypothetical protein
MHQSESAMHNPIVSRLPAKIWASMAEISRRQRAISPGPVIHLNASPKVVHRRQREQAEDNFDPPSRPLEPIPSETKPPSGMGRTQPCCSRASPASPDPCLKASLSRSEADRSSAGLFRVSEAASSAESTYSFRRSRATSLNDRPSRSITACLPVKFCHRITATST